MSRAINARDAQLTQEPAMRTHRWLHARNITLLKEGYRFSLGQLHHETGERLGMPYVIQRIPDGAYVAPRGSKSSYTRALQRARVFSTREQADGERCPGNEIVVDVNDILGRY